MYLFQAKHSNNDLYPVAYVIVPKVTQTYDGYEFTKDLEHWFFNVDLQASWLDNAESVEVTAELDTTWNDVFGGGTGQGILDDALAMSDADNRTTIPVNVSWIAFDPQRTSTPGRPFQGTVTNDTNYVVFESSTGSGMGAVSSISWLRRQSQDYNIFGDTGCITSPTDFSFKLWDLPSTTDYEYHRAVL